MALTIYTVYIVVACTCCFLIWHMPFLSTISDVLLVLLFCIFTAWCMKFLWSKRKLYIYSRKVPGLFALPFIGPALFALRNPHDAHNVLLFHDQCPSSIFKVWFGTTLYFLISEPKYHEILLTKCLHKNGLYSLFQPLGGHGLFSAPYDTWKRHRKIISPTFNQKILDEFVKVFSKQSGILAEQLKTIAGKGEQDIIHMISKCTVDITCETAMGVSGNTQTSDVTPVGVWIDRAIGIVSLRMKTLWYHIDPIFNLSPISKKFWSSVQNFHNFCDKIIREKKALCDKARKEIDSAPVYCNEGGTRKKAFLDHLLELTADGNDKFSEEELRHEVYTFIVAASDTTSTISSYIMVMLGMHKELQEEIYEEVLAVVGPNRPVERSDIAQLENLDRFIKETLRLFPIGPIMGRSVTEDTDIGDYIIPEGAMVIFLISRTHTYEKYWPDPYRFDPDRFLPEEVAKRHPCAYIPFSYGPRNCIGFRYAMLSMKVLVATVIRKFKISTPYKNVQDIKLVANVFSKPKDGFKVSLELR